ncbi:MAG: hypothetical protein IT285_09635 [Bdellovibrionales bacterium]|nr:hypothetical protein [Bdellovibrionales bacterium]
MIARSFGLRGNVKPCIRWAKRALLALRRFSRLHPEWHNAYFFHAMALGYLGRIEEMEEALRDIAKHSGKTADWRAIGKLRTEIMEAVETIEHA